MSAQRSRRDTRMTGTMLHNLVQEGGEQNGAALGAEGGLQHR